MREKKGEKGREREREREREARSEKLSYERARSSRPLTLRFYPFFLSPPFSHSFIEKFPLGPLRSSCSCLFFFLSRSLPPAFSAVLSLMGLSSVSLILLSLLAEELLSRWFSYSALFFFFSFLPSSYSPAGDSFSIRVHTRERVFVPLGHRLHRTISPSPFFLVLFCPCRSRCVLHSSNLNAGRTGVLYRLRKWTRGMPSFYCGAAIAIKSLVLFTFVSTRALSAAVFLSRGLIALVWRFVSLAGAKWHTMHLDRGSVSFGNREQKAEIYLKKKKSDGNALAKITSVGQNRAPSISFSFFLSFPLRERARAFRNATRCLFELSRCVTRQETFRKSTFVRIYSLAWHLKSKTSSSRTISRNMKPTLYSDIQWIFLDVHGMSQSLISWY